MKKRKTLEILLDPIDYWEMKLNINFKTEFIRYKKLCAKLTKKEMRKLDGVYYITYSDWRHRIITFINLLEQSELDEFKHYLIGCSNRSNIFNRISLGHFLPFLVSFLLPYTNNFLNTLYGPNFSIFILVSCFVGGVLCFYDLIIDTKNDLLWSDFYNDIIHIIESHEKSSKI